MEIQNLDPLWFGQVENECFPQLLSTNAGKSNISNCLGTSSNPKGKQHRDNVALALNNIRPPSSENIANGQHTLDMIHFEVPINYDINTPTEANAWDGKAHSISIFGHMEFLEIDAKNIFTSLLYMADFIRAKKVQQGKISDIAELQGFGEVAWSFILSIYEAGWDSIPINDQNVSFRNAVSNKLASKVSKSTINMSSSKLKDKVAEIVKLPPSIPACPPKEVLEKSKFISKGNKSRKTVNTNVRKSFTQATSFNVSDILKLKESFPSLLAKKIEEIHKIINNTDKVKSHLNMTMKDPSRKQIIIPMSKENVDNILVTANKYIANINRALKNIKSNVIVDFIHSENMGITIVSNSIALQSNLQVIERYVKNIDNIRSNDIQVLRLTQSKSYLKITGILYFVEGTNTPIRSDNIKVIIKSNHIFNDLSLTSKPKVIKASPKSDIAVIWIDV